MPATDLRQLYNFENNFERATVAILNAGGLNDAFLSGGMAELPQTRIEVMFATGAALNETALPSGDHVYDFFAATLTIRIVTFRPEDSPSLIPGVSTLHSEFAATVRALMQERAAPYNAANLPLYAVKTIAPAGTARGLEPRWLEDFTALEFAIQFGIRDDAWPS